MACECSHCTHMWQTPARTHRITKTGDVGHTTSLTRSLFIEVSLTSQESEWFIFMSVQ